MDMENRYSIISAENLAPATFFDRIVTEVIRKSNSFRTPRLLPLDSLVKQLVSLGCKTALIQNRVSDPDYYAEFQAFYSRSFGDINRFCQRIHFFTLPAADPSNPTQFIDLAAVSESSYLGFATIRPIRSSPLGATIVAFNSSNGFLICKDRFPVHLAGREFFVDGTPFMQQDNAVGACAQTAIWMALRTMRKREGTRAHNPAQITEAATRFLTLGRTLPNREGLDLSQMAEAVRAAGYSPHVLIFRAEIGALPDDELERARLTLYSYIESGIPVVLGLFPKGSNGHAVTMIGHGWESQPPEPLKFTDISIGSTEYFKVVHPTSWIGHFLIHNDNSGPYQSFFDRRLDDSNRCYVMEDLVFAMPLLPDDVYINGEEAYQLSMELLSWLLSQIRDLGGDIPVISEKVIARTYLTDRHSFRRWAAETAIPSVVANVYRTQSMPRRLWVTELSLVDDYGNLAKSSQPCRVGEIVIDPTADPDDIPFLFAHLNTIDTLGFKAGVIIIRDPDTHEIFFNSVEDDRMYSSQCR